MGKITTKSHQRREKDSEDENPILGNKSPNGVVASNLATDTEENLESSVPTEMAEGNRSPPKAEVDDSPLQHAMDRNKECEYTLLLFIL